MSECDVDDFLASVLVPQVAAEHALHNGDLAPRLALWSNDDSVTLFGALGPCDAGWDAVSRTFRWVAARFSGCTTYHFDLVAADVSGDLAYTVGYEHCTASFDGGPPTSTVLRVTHVYRREGGAWKIVHRHGDYFREDQGSSASAPGSPATTNES